MCYWTVLELVFVEVDLSIDLCAWDVLKLEFFLVAVSILAYKCMCYKHASKHIFYCFYFFFFFFVMQSIGT